MERIGRFEQEAGSLPMVLLAAIVLGGLIISVSLTVTSGSRTAVADRSYHYAVQVADAGIQEAFMELKDLEPDQRPACDTNEDGTCSGEFSDGSPYTWEYERLSDNRWQVRSRGTHRDRSRFVEADIGETPLFDVALLAKSAFTYNGGGGGTDPFAAGTFQDATLNGNPAINSVGQLMLYGDGPHNVNVPPNQVPQEHAEAPTLNNIGMQAFAPGGICEDEPYYEEFPADHPDAHPRHGSIYCVGKVDFGNGTHPMIGSSSDGPAMIFVDQSGSTAVRTAGNGSVNWGSDRSSSDLQIYVAEGDVTISGSSSFAGSVWAPASACTSNGGTTIEGAMVCNSITLNGNFSFDPDVDEITDEDFSISNWREESEGTTSF